MALLEELEIQGNWLFRRRSFLPIIIYISAIPLFIIQTTHQEQLCYYYNHLFIIIGFVVSLLGIFLRIFIVGFTADNTSGRNTENQVADSINTTGIYSIIRHPLYFANYIIYLGISISIGNALFSVIFSLIFWLYYERIMFAEEQFLRNKFQTNYINYANITNAFIPNFKNYKKPTNNFNFKKVLKKEKDGLMATVFMFTFIDTILQILIFNNIKFYYWISICSVVFIFYLIIRYLKYHSKILN